MTTLKASGNTQIQKLAGAIAGNIRQEGEVQISLDDPTPSDIAVQPEFLMQNFSEPAATENREVTTIMLHIHKVEFDPAHAVSSDVPHHEEGEATL